MGMFCQKMGEKYPAGRGVLANRVLHGARGSGRNENEPVEEYEQGCVAKYMRVIAELFLDVWSAFAVFAKYACKLETALSCTLSVTAVLLYREVGENLAANMSWTLVSFAVVFPLSLTISQSFRRRDDALLNLAELRSALYNVLIAHMKWNWVGAHKQYNGRADPPTRAPMSAGGACSSENEPICNVEDEKWQLETRRHKMYVYRVTSDIVDAVRQYLLVPRSGQARHVYTSSGAEEAGWIGWAEEVGGAQVTRLIALLHDATEEMKRYGMPATEASRINQYLFFMSRSWEKTRVLKEYRTPQAMRNFTRVMVHVLPALYGPYFLEMSRGHDGEQDNVVFACVFAALVSVFLCALLLVQTSLENPYDPNSLDTVKVDLEMGRTQRLFETLLDDLGMDWQEFEMTYATDPAAVHLGYVAGRPVSSGVPVQGVPASAAGTPTQEFDDTTLPNHAMSVDSNPSLRKDLC